MGRPGSARTVSQTRLRRSGGRARSAVGRLRQDDVAGGGALDGGADGGDQRLRGRRGQGLHPQDVARHHHAEQPAGDQRAARLALRGGGVERAHDAPEDLRDEELAQQFRRPLVADRRPHQRQEFCWCGQRRPWCRLRRDRGREPGMIVGVPAPELITDAHDPRVADFRGLKAGDRPAGTPRGTGPVIVEGVPAVERLLASPYRVGPVFGVPGRVAALDLPEDLPAYEADKWVLSEVIGFRLPRGVLASAHRRPPADLDELIAGPDPAAPRRLAVLEALNDAENLGSIARSAVALGIDGLLLDPRCADPLYRRSVRVSMGHILGLPFAVVPEWPAGLERLHHAGYTTVALTPAPDAVDLGDLDPTAHPRTAVLLGAEGPGLTPEAQQAATVRARRPMRREVRALGVDAAPARALAPLR